MSFGFSPAGLGAGVLPCGDAPGAGVGAGFSMTAWSGTARTFCLVLVVTTAVAVMPGRRASRTSCGSFDMSRPMTTLNSFASCTLTRSCSPPLVVADLPMASGDVGDDAGQRGVLRGLVAQGDVATQHRLLLVDARLARLDRGLRALHADLC